MMTERERFEEWAKKHYFEERMTFDDGEYLLPEYQTAWTAWQAALKGRGEPLDIALNIKHADCYKSANAFWEYWRENGIPHKHGYFESTWGAINQALRYVGVIPHIYQKPRIEVKGEIYLSDCISITPPNTYTEKEVDEMMMKVAIESFELGLGIEANIGDKRCCRAIVDKVKAGK